jgi:hypothetical protein
MLETAPNHSSIEAARQAEACPANPERAPRRPKAAFRYHLAAVAMVREDRAVASALKDIADGKRPLRRGVESSSPYKA